MRRLRPFIAILLLTTASTLDARAAITPGAQRTVDRYLAAVGGRAAGDRVHGVAVRGTLTAFGLAGTLRAWHERPDRRASEVELGPLKIADGFDGTRGWRTDPSGKTVLFDGLNLADERVRAWFENERWLEPDQGGGAVAEGGVEKDSLGTYTVLEVTPPAAPELPTPRTHRLWFDDRTGLLVRTVSKRDDKTVVNISSDYRRVEGYLMPFVAVTKIEGMPANDARVVLDSVALNPVLAPARFAPPATADAHVRWLKTPGLARLPFEYASRHIWLRLAVNGAPPASFLFDTGASITVLDSAYAASLGIAAVGHQEGTGAGATGGASFATLRSLRAESPAGDGVELADLNIAVLALNRYLAPFFWRDVAGVVGFDFIQRFVDTIDFDAGTLVLQDPATFHYEGRGTAIPMQLAGTVPVVAMTLEGVGQGLFRLDFGSSATVDLHTPFVKAHGLLDAPGPRRDVPGGGFGGTFRVVARRGPRLVLGPYAVERPVLGLPQAVAGAFTSEDYAGNLGNRFFDRFTCTLDYERRQLYLEPGRRYAEPDVFPRGGVLCARLDGRLAVVEVIPDSPAAAAGVKGGDVLIALDGTAAAALTPDGLDATLERGAVGSRHTLELERAGKRVRATIVLRDLL